MGGLTLLPYTQNTVHIGFWRLLRHLEWEPEENKSLVPKTFPFLLPLTLYPFSLRYTEWKFVGRSPPLPATAVGLQRLAAQPNNSKLFICSHVLFLKEKNEYVHFAKCCFLQQKHLLKKALLHRNLGYFPMVVGIAVELSLARSLGILREMYESREGRGGNWIEKSGGRGGERESALLRCSLKNLFFSTISEQRRPGYCVWTVLYRCRCETWLFSRVEYESFFYMFK